jgi:ComF family protein
MQLSAVFKKLLKAATKYWITYVDLLFPRCCIQCARSADAEHYKYLCKRCARQFFLCHEPSCHFCGQPFWGSFSDSRICPNCLELSPKFSEGKTLFLAKDVGRSLIHELKYAAGFYVLQDIQALIGKSAYWRAFFSDTILCPVPLHPRKMRQRGYNQSKKIAICIAQCFPLQTEVQAPLIRITDTQSQTTLNREQRRQNIKNAFAIRADTVLNPHLCYVIVDDVFTTGATLNACATVLRTAGAQKIKTFTLGHG